MTLLMVSVPTSAAAVALNQFLGLEKPDLWPMYEIAEISVAVMLKEQLSKTIACITAIA